MAQKEGSRGGGGMAKIDASMGARGGFGRGLLRKNCGVIFCFSVKKGAGGRAGQTAGEGMATQRFKGGKLEKRKKRGGQGKKAASWEESGGVSWGKEKHTAM